jgi:hypothetical protein
LVKGQSTEYVFQWRWKYESGDDEYDTFLGNLSTKENVGVAVKFDVYSVANTEIGTNGGFVESGLSDIVAAAVAFVLLSAAITLTIVVLVKRRNQLDV